MDPTNPLNAAAIGLGIGAVAWTGKKIVTRWLGRPRKARLRKGRGSGLKLTAQDAITLDQLYEGAFVFGATGSGKTSGPIAATARLLMREGAGMVILAAKKTDWLFWLKLAEECGRGADIRRFGVEAAWRFEFLGFELRSEGGSPESAASMLSNLIEVTSRSKGGGGDDRWWQEAANRDFRNIVAAVFKAWGSCSIPDVYRFATSRPSTAAAMKTPEFAKGFAGRTLLRLAALPDDSEKELLADYHADEILNLSEKTRSIIHTMVVQTLSRFMTGPLARLVAEGDAPELTPLDALAGKIIVIDTPTLVWKEAGQLILTAWKDSVQRACLRRDDGRPVALICDEAQLTVLGTDTEVQAVARSHKLIQVFATQNMPLLISALGGGDQARMQAEALIANCQTKVFCANGCKETNQFASDLLGHSKQMFASVSEPTGGFDLVADMFGMEDARQGNVSASEHWHPDVPPGELTRLAKGGKANGCVVEAFLFQGGRLFSNGRTWIKCRFLQGES